MHSIAFSPIEGLNQGVRLPDPSNRESTRKSFANRVSLTDRVQEFRSYKEVVERESLYKEVYKENLYTK